MIDMCFISGGLPVKYAEMNTLLFSSFIKKFITSLCLLKAIVLTLQCEIWNFMKLRQLLCRQGTDNTRLKVSGIPGDSGHFDLVNSRRHVTSLIESRSLLIIKLFPLLMAVNCIPRCYNMGDSTLQKSLTVLPRSVSTRSYHVTRFPGRESNKGGRSCCKLRTCLKALSRPFNRCGVYNFEEMQRQTMYDFVNDWSPLPFGLQHKPHWSTPSKYLEKTWKVFDQSKDCFMSQDLEEENCKCTSHAKTARRRRLRSKSGFYLTVMPNGQVLGVKDPTSSYISLDVIPVGADLVKIWGVEAELFLMIDDAGLLRATDVDSPECIFEESLTEDFCTMYYSAMYSHKRWCVGLKTRPLSTFSGALRRNKLSLRDCSFMAEIVNRRSSTSSSQSCGSDGRICS